MTAGIHGTRHRSERRLRGAVPQLRAWPSRRPTCSNICAACRTHRSAEWSACKWWSTCRPTALPEFVALVHGEAEAGRPARYRNAQPGMPGDLRPPFLPGPDARQAGAPALLSFYLEESRLRAAGNRAAGARHRKHAVAGIATRRFSGGLFRQPRLRHLRPEALAASRRSTLPGSLSSW